MQEIERRLDKDYSVKNFCMKCSKGENLLICRSKTCPIVVHQRCVRCPVFFDDDGRFFCPYCVYCKAEEELLRARKDLLIFLGVETVGGARESEENQVVEANYGRMRLKDHTRKMHGPSCDDRDNGDYVEETSHKKQKIRNGVEGRTQEDEPGTVAAASLGQFPSVEATKHNVVDADVETSQKREDGTNRASKSEALPEDKKDNSSGSGGQDSAPDNRKEQNISNAPNQELSIVVYRTPLTPQRRSSRRAGSLASEKFSNYRFDPSTSSEQHQQRTSTSDADFLITRKSKRVMWRSEEVEMLKKGVQEFSRENRNIPWRKILEYGHEVFDVNRTPSDLKEKWKKVPKG